MVLTPGPTTVTTTSKTSLPAVVQKLDLEVEWEIIGKGLKRDPADESTPIYAPNVKSGHEVLVTLGEPQTVDPTYKKNPKKAVTYERMAYAAKTVGALNSTAPHTIVEKMLKGFRGFSLGTQFNSSWKVAENTFVDCHAIIQYIADAIKMVGCAGDAKVVLVFPRLKNKA